MKTANNTFDKKFALDAKTNDAACNFDAEEKSI